MTTVDRFGVEVECHGITRRAAAEAIRSVVGGEVRYLGGTYDTWACIGPDGRKWQAMRDSSIRAIGDYQVEVVTPILTRADMENFQAVIRAVKGAGAKVDDSCGIHVHIDGAPFNPASLLNLVKIVWAGDALIHYALNIHASRAARFCKKINPELITRLKANPDTRQSLASAWYGTASTATAEATHYESSRYQGLNLHSWFFRGTVEFRWFEATLHAGKIRAYVELALALGNTALKESASSRRVFSKQMMVCRANFQAFFRRLGITDKAVRGHLLERVKAPAFDAVEAAALALWQARRNANNQAASAA